MNKNNLTRQQLKDLESLFELVSDRQLKDFGNISASNKSDGSLICLLYTSPSPRDS